MAENEIREALNRHWAASDANDFDVEHNICREDAVLEYPQSGERIRARATSRLHVAWHLIGVWRKVGAGGGRIIALPYEIAAWVSLGS
jgi:hypothetical protein